MTTKATAATTYYATKAFKDAGTERSFAFGKPVDVDEATALNYEAAGLVSTEKPEAEQPAASKPAA
ncbi:hypothetical protein ACVOMT_11680 [Sphingomonas panni]